MAKQKKTKKGDPKKISKFDQSLSQSLSQGANQESYQTLPAYTPPAPASQPPRKKYVKETLFPRKVMALFSERQYQELSDLVTKMRQKDGNPHSLNSVIRVAVERLVEQFR